MSPKSKSDKGKAPSKPAATASSSKVGESDGAHDDAAKTAPPAYMTVGNGSTSEHAARLQSMLDNDSGYGGSSTGGEDLHAMLPSTMPWGTAAGDDPSLQPPAGSSSGSGISGVDRRAQQASAIHQLWYNQHRVSLGKSISQVVELLKGLQEINTTWPAHYPTVQGDAPPSAPSSDVCERPSLQRAHSTAGDLMTSASLASTSPPGRSHRDDGDLRRSLRRAKTSLEDMDGPSRDAESSKSAEKRAASPAPSEPRLVTPQIAQEFSVLKLDLKLGSLHQAELVHSLEKGSVAALLDEKIRSSIKHLLALRERIEDTSSKVLVTGDLNAGKSTFCNALLRRKILPEDQQPCTSIFCEVLDASANHGVEEVHAVHKDAIYDRNDESTYDVFALAELERIVTDNNTYMQCKVYVKDVRAIDESLLNNGIVDIALIDAPGLNSDTTKTTAVFARQEEIDVVVFVVSATNHFTLTATEFIRAAAAEKAYLFVVVNGFDVIRDRDRCQKMILDQVAGLSPQTRKEASELVHFVSSNAIPTGPSPPGGPGGPGGGGSGSSSGGGGGDDPSDDDPKGKGKAKEKMRDFEGMEQSLRRFVLEKRARSKLAPAKNYLLNILNDVNALATVNAEVAQSELSRVNDELATIEPQLESNKKAKVEVATDAEQIIEEACKDIYDHSRAAIGFSITHAGDSTDLLGVPYPGLLSAFQYADDVKQAMLAQISAAVTECEERARAKTVSGVNAIKQLGLLHLGNDYADLIFRPELMFRRRRDGLARQINIPTDLWDFVDVTTLLQRQEKMAGTGMALTVATAVGGRLIGVQSWGWIEHAMSAVKLMSNEQLRSLAGPALLAAVVAAAAYVLSQIPQTLPPRLAQKISTQLDELDYVHINATRISSTVRKVLRCPADSIRDGLSKSVEQLGTRREKTIKARAESQIALKYFGNLVTDSARYRTTVQTVDLEALPPGAH